MANMLEVKTISGSFVIAKIAGTESTAKIISVISKKTKAVTYTCSMHPEVTADKPGKCSKCGMELIKKK